MNIPWIYVHLFADFLCQNDWMAQGKKTKFWPGIIHAFVYGFFFAVFCQMAPWQVSLITLQHFYQDSTNFIPWLMKVKGSEKFATDPYSSPWSVIVTDQIVHILWIAFIVWLPKGMALL